MEHLFSEFIGGNEMHGFLEILVIIETHLKFINEFNFYN